MVLAAPEPASVAAHAVLIGSFLSLAVLDFSRNPQLAPGSHGYVYLHLPVSDAAVAADMWRRSLSFRWLCAAAFGMLYVAQVMAVGGAPWQLAAALVLGATQFFVISATVGVLGTLWPRAPFALGCLALLVALGVVWFLPKPLPAALAFVYVLPPGWCGAALEYGVLGGRAIGYLALLPVAVAALGWRWACAARARRFIMPTLLADAPAAGAPREASARRAAGDTDEVRAALRRVVAAPRGGVLSRLLTPRQRQLAVFLEARERLRTAIALAVLGVVAAGCLSPFSPGGGLAIAALLWVCAVISAVCRRRPEQTSGVTVLPVAAYPVSYTEITWTQTVVSTIILLCLLPLTLAATALLTWYHDGNAAAIETALRAVLTVSVVFVILLPGGHGLGLLTRSPGQLGVGVGMLAVCLMMILGVCVGVFLVGAFLEDFHIGAILGALPGSGLAWVVCRWLHDRCQVDLVLVPQGWRIGQ
jgi:hypothetical protein